MPFPPPKSEGAHMLICLWTDWHSGYTTYILWGSKFGSNICYFVALFTQSTLSKPLMHVPFLLLIKSESPSQVFIIVLPWLCMVLKNINPANWSKHFWLSVTCCYGLLLIVTVCYLLLRSVVLVVTFIYWFLRSLTDCHGQLLVVMVIYLLRFVTSVDLL